MISCSANRTTRRSAAAPSTTKPLHLSEGSSVPQSVRAHGEEWSAPCTGAALRSSIEHDGYTIEQVGDVRVVTRDGVLVDDDTAERVVMEAYGSW